MKGFSRHGVIDGLVPDRRYMMISAEPRRSLRNVTLKVTLKLERNHPGPTSDPCHWLQRAGEGSLAGSHTRRRVRIPPTSESFVQGHELHAELRVAFAVRAFGL